MLNNRELDGRNEWKIQENVRVVLSKDNIQTRGPCLQGSVVGIWKKMKKTSAVSVMVCWFQAPLENLQLVPCHANVLPDPAIAIPTFEIVCSTDGSDPMRTIFVVFILLAGPGTLNSVMSVSIIDSRFRQLINGVHLADIR